jgi:hypothetical protein
VQDRRERVLQEVERRRQRIVGAADQFDRRRSVRRHRAGSTVCSTSVVLPAVPMAKR